MGTLYLDRAAGAWSSEPAPGRDRSGDLGVLRLGVGVVTSLYGYGPLPLSARTDDTAPTRAVTAVMAATMTERTFLNRWGIPGSFQDQGAGSCGEGMLSLMRLSTIAKQSVAGGGSEFSRALGAEIRRRRVALGLSQASVGHPLSRAFMSSVERGRLTPSLPSLLMIAERLNMSAGGILASVEGQLEGRVRDANNSDETPIPR